MTIRSFLFVPGDSERKIAKVTGGPADALILDLEDAVAQERLPTARAMVCEHLKAHPDRSRQQLWVRVNPLDTKLSLPDLAGVMAGAPDGIVLPKTDDGSAVVKLCHYLSALEAREGIEIGRTQILVVATETAKSLFHLDSYAGSSPRIYGLTWGAEDLAAALFATTNRTPDGEYEGPYKLARTLCLAGARAAGVEPVDTLLANFRDTPGLEAEALQARKVGFTGKIAIHPDQVEPINRAFTPDEAEVAYAKRVVEAFANSTTGTVGMDGKMLDMPHLKQARHVLATAEKFAGR